MTDPRRLAVALVGFCAFLPLYAPQSLLPMFAAEFGAGPAAVNALIGATTLAVALTAPLAGALADRFGRRRIIVLAVFALVAPTMLLAASGSLGELVFWRFVQGLLLPPIFTVAVAYIGEEWPPGEVPSVIAVYMAGSAFGGFLGRFLAGLAADHFGWPAAFLAMAAIDFAGAVLIALYLPPERGFVASTGLAASLRAMPRHLANRRLLATFGAGFALLFAFVAAFTYVNFHLAEPPFNLSAGALGAIFVVYLSGVLTTSMSGRFIARHGYRRMAVIATGVWIAALGLTLIESLAAIIAGLAISAAAGFVMAALANGYLTSVAQHARAAAIGLFATFYYIGGSIGAVLPAPLYAVAGWPGVVALVAAVLALMAAAILWAWEPLPPARPHA